MTSFDTLLSNYFDKIKDDYPELTLAELSIICRNPFSFLKKQMRQINVPTIRFQYFGIFTVKKGSFAIRTTVNYQTDKGRAKLEKLQAVIDYNQNKHDKSESES